MTIKSIKNFQKIDQFGRTYLAAPKGKVLKGYLIWDIDNHKEHILIDEYGLVFRSGKWVGGWSSGPQHSDISRMIVFPNPVERGNDPYNKSHWDWDHYWEKKNWQCDSYAWMYMKNRLQQRE